MRGLLRTSKGPIRAYNILAEIKSCLGGKISLCLIIHAYLSPTMQQNTGRNARHFRITQICTRLLCLVCLAYQILGELFLRYESPS